MISSLSNVITACRRNLLLRPCIFLILATLSLPCAQAQTDPLPSWNDASAKQSITAFVERVTKEGSPDFVAPEDRIATFDNDGTLWTEQPMYTELAFALQRVVEMASNHPEWKTTQPFAAVLHHDQKALAASGTEGVMKLFVATHSGMMTEEFEKIVSDWLDTAQHPRFHRLYTKCVYQPMLELLAYLRANGFKTYIVSGGEQDFMRPFTEKVYGVPREQVIGTLFKTQYVVKSEGPVLVRLPSILSVDDGPGKPQNIERFIGKKPIAAFGNSDGDIQMLEWTQSNPKPNLELLVHHTDAEREYAYDKDSSMGRLDKGLTEAAAKHWIVVSMKTDWKTIFPAQ